MIDISIRTAVIDDLPILLAFERGIIETERPWDPTVRTGNDVHYYDLAELVESPDAEVIVAVSDGEIVGSGYALIITAKPYRTYDRYAYLGFMYVVPEFRGAGVNKRIIEGLENWSRSQGVTEMILEVYAENSTAIRAYEKSGYAGIVLRMRKPLGGTG